MAKTRSWEVSDEFWKRVEPFIPEREREPGKVFRRKAGGGRKRMPERRVFEGIVFVLRTGCHRMRVLHPTESTEEAQTRPSSEESTLGRGSGALLVLQPVSKASRQI